MDNDQAWVPGEMSYEALILQCALLHPHHITSFRGSLIIAYCSWTWLMDNGVQVLDNGANASASANARSRYHNGVRYVMVYDMVNTFVDV